MRAVIALTLITVTCAQVSAQNEAPIVHEGVVEAPLEQVWTAFTTSAGLRSWLAPHAEIDLRVGGLMRANYNPDGRIGDAGTIENVILSFDPPRMISIKVARPPAGFPFPNAVRTMWTVIYFSSAGPSSTSVREVTLGFTRDPESQRMRAFFAQGNATTFAQLQRHFASQVQR